jgi:hypothetical protein
LGEQFLQEVEFALPGERGAPRNRASSATKAVDLRVEGRVLAFEEDRDLPQRLRIADVSEAQRAHYIIRAPAKQNFSARRRHRTAPAKAPQAAG